MGTGYILEEINECVSACPSGFQRAEGSRCLRCLSSPENGFCGGACREKHIRSIGDFQSLRYCTRVHTLNIYNIETVEFRGSHFLEAYSAFSSLEQIDHEFTIHNVKVFFYHSFIFLYPCCRDKQEIYKQIFQSINHLS